MANIQPNRRRRIDDPDLERKIEEFSQGASSLSVVQHSEPLPSPSEDEVVPAKKAVASVGFNFKMTPENHQRLKALCSKEERSIQYMLNKIVWAEISRLEENDQ